jgi:hypothetical protein
LTIIDTDHNCHFSLVYRTYCLFFVSFSGKAKNVPRESADQAQSRMRKLRQKLDEESAKRRLLEESNRHKKLRKDDVINLTMAVEPFDETRGSLVLEFFIKHFIAMAKKSNEFRSYGQGHMYLMQAENLMRLLKESGFYGTSSHVDLMTDIEQLRQLNRDSTEDYWHISWGPEDKPRPTTGGGGGGSTGGTQTMANGGSGGSAHARLLRPQNSLKEQSMPLPKIPSTAAMPIPGTEEPRPNEQMVAVDVHVRKD